jgi:hypothetical protein
LIFFAKNRWCVSLVRDSAGAASNNKPTRGRLAEGYGLHVSPSEAVSLQD